jgi:hypothetical protein
MTSFFSQGQMSYDAVLHSYDKIVDDQSLPSILLEKKMSTSYRAELPIELQNLT